MLQGSYLTCRVFVARPNADPGTMSFEANLGPQLRAARTERGISVREVARRIGVSPSLVSQIETGKTQPSVGTLYALLTELDLPFDTLISGGAETERGPAEPSRKQGVRYIPSPVVRREDRTVLHLEGGVVWERLNTLLPDVVDFLYVTYPPGACASVTGKHMRHMGIEFGYILEGAITITIQDERYVVEAGDAVSFDSSVPHLLENEGSTDAHGVWCVFGRALLHSDLLGTRPNSLAALFGAHREPNDKGGGGEAAESVSVVKAARVPARRPSTNGHVDREPGDNGGAASGRAPKRRPSRSR